MAAFFYALIYDPVVAATFCCRFG